MPTILTSDEFVAGIVAVLALQHRKPFTLTDTELDECFENAFRDLLEHKAALGVTPNFTFIVDPLHGDSVSLRETLIAAKEKELIALNNPTFRTFDVKLSEEGAERYLDKNPIQRSFLEGVVERHFDGLDD